MQSDLVERAQRGDAEAFGALVHGCVDRLYAIAQRILRDPDRAEDALQQTLIHMWEDLPSLRDPERFGVAPDAARLARLVGELARVGPYRA